MNKNLYQIDNFESHARLLADSFFRIIHCPLLSVDSSSNLIDSMNQAPFAIVSHGTEDDPIFNFANRVALQLFELDFKSFTTLPSRKSAEPMNQEDRNRLLTEVSDHGYIANYTGIRISSSGKRFRIKDAIVWNVIDEHGKYCGQAAKIAQWAPLGQAECS